MRLPPLHLVLLLLAFWFGSASTAFAQSVDTSGCFYFTVDTVYLKPIIYLGTRDTVLTMKLRDSSIGYVTLRIGGDDSAQFSSLTPFPLRITSGRDQLLTLRYSPTRIGSASTTLFFQDTANRCAVKTIVLIGTAMDTSARTDTLSFFRVYPEAYALRASSDTIRRKIYLRNNSSGSIDVQSVGVSHGQFFAVEHVLPMPQTVTPNGVFVVEILFAARDSGFYEDELIVLTSHELTEEYTSLQAWRESAKASVHRQEIDRTSASLRRVGRFFTVERAPFAVTELHLYDILGRRIALIHGGSNIWHSPHHLLGGVYVVELTNGTRRLTTKLLIE